jgi:hypothetical protein
MHKKKGLSRYELVQELDDTSKGTRAKERVCISLQAPLRSSSSQGKVPERYGPQAGSAENAITQPPGADNHAVGPGRELPTDGRAAADASRHAGASANSPTQMEDKW